MWPNLDWFVVDQWPPLLVRTASVMAWLCFCSLSSQSLAWCARRACKQGAWAHLRLYAAELRRESEPRRLGALSLAQVSNCSPFCVRCLFPLPLAYRNDCAHPWWIGMRRGAREARNVHPQAQATAALEGRTRQVSEVAGTLTLEGTAFLSLPWLGEPSLSQHRSGVIQSHHGLDRSAAARIVPTCVDQARCRVLSASLGRPHCFASGGVLRPGSVAGLCIRTGFFVWPFL